MNLLLEIDDVAIITNLEPLNDYMHKTTRQSLFRIGVRIYRTLLSSLYFNVPQENKTNIPVMRIDQRLSKVDDEDSTCPWNDFYQSAIKEDWKKYTFNHKNQKLALAPNSFRFFNQLKRKPNYLCLNSFSLVDLHGIFR
eukprot:Pgem_evm2s605